MKKQWALLFFILIILISAAGCSQQSVSSDSQNKSVIEHPADIVESESPSPQENPVTSKENNLPAETKQAEQPVKIEGEAQTVTSGQQTFGWYFVRNSEHKTPGINNNLGFSLAEYNAFYVGDTSQKVIYLTFDEGYENGYTSRILDILKDNQVPAAFFVTEPYIKTNPELIKRMLAEGHLVGNHSKTHPSMPSKTGNLNEFNKEIIDVAAAYKELTGHDMPLFFRPPRGEFSQESLRMTKELGYTTIFWSFAYQDWLTDNQPDPQKAYENIMQGIHNGEIMLLHAVSSTNTEILDKVIKDIKSEGYRFAPLSEINK
jgi:peptidoglycan-N-acetylmuramic acid deacetylase